MKQVSEAQRIADVASRHPGLRALVLFGSRARGDAAPNADWDFGHLTDEQFDPAALLADLVCVQRNLGTPSSYGDAFDRLSAAGELDASLASRLVKAAGFRDLIAHAYEKVDMARIHEAATNGPADLRAFLK